MSSDSYKSNSRYGSWGNNRTRQSPPRRDHTQRPYESPQYPQRHDRRYYSNSYSPHDHYGPQWQHRLGNETHCSPYGPSSSSRGRYGPRGQHQDQEEDWRLFLSTEMKRDTDALDEMSTKNRGKCEKYRKKKKAENIRKEAIVDKSLSVLDNTVNKMTATVDKSLSTVKETTKESLSTVKETTKESLSTMKEITKESLSTVNKMIATVKEITKENLSTIEKIAAARSPSIGEKRKRQASVDEVEIDSRKKRRETESNSKSLLDEIKELKNKVAGLEETVQRKDEKIYQLMESIIQEGQNHSAEVVELTKSRKAERNEIASLYRDKVVWLEAKVANLEAENCKLRAQGG